MLILIWYDWVGDGCVKDGLKYIMEYNEVDVGEILGSGDCVVSRVLLNG